MLPNMDMGSSIWDAELSADDSLVGAVDGTRTMRIWSAVSGLPICEPLRGHSLMNRLEFSPESELVAGYHTTYSVRYQPTARAYSDIDCRTPH